MNKNLITLHIPPLRHIKALSKALFLFLLVASFLASCTTEEPAEIINNIGDGDPPTLTCPSGDNTGIVGEAVTWAEPTLENDPTGTTLEVSTAPADATDISTTGATFPTATNYTVTVTAMEGSTPVMVDGAALICSFTVNVTEMAMPIVTDTTAPVIDSTTCTDITHTPELAAGTTSIATSELSPPPAVTATDGSGADPTISYTPDTISLTTGTSTIEVTAIATDSAGNTATCTFNVIVTVADDDTTVVEPPPVELLFSLATEDGVPSATNPFLIEDADDLSNLAAVVNSGTVTVDGTEFVNEFEAITGGSPGSYSTANYQLMTSITLSDENNFTPIGIGSVTTMIREAVVVVITTCTSTCFEGTFDGDGNTISGLHFNNVDETSTESTNVGLFGAISGENAWVSNLRLTGVNITGTTNVGGLVGTIINSASLSSVSVAGSVNGSNIVGGLVGAMKSSRATNVSASATINAVISGSTSGGIVGLMDASSITNAFASGNVSGAAILGGLAGNVNNGSSITNAAASGAVSAMADLVGLAGGLVGNITGENNSISILKNTLAWGEVSTTTQLVGVVGAGGLVGLASGSFTITDSYWDTTTTMQTTSPGVMDMPMPGDNPNNTNYSGQDTDSLRIEGGPTTIYATWNTDPTLDVDGTPGDDTPWTFEDGQYPAINGLFITVACQRNPADASCSQ